MNRENLEPITEDEKKYNIKFFNEHLKDIKLVLGNLCMESTLEYLKNAPDEVKSNIGEYIYMRLRMNEMKFGPYTKAKAEEFGKFEKKGILWAAMTDDGNIAVPFKDENRDPEHLYDSWFLLRDERIVKSSPKNAVEASQDQ